MTTQKTTYAAFVYFPEFAQAEESVGAKVRAIKLLRAITGGTLKDTKEFVEQGDGTQVLVTAEQLLAVVPGHEAILETFVPYLLDVTGSDNWTRVIEFRDVHPFQVEVPRTLASECGAS